MCDHLNREDVLIALRGYAAACEDAAVAEARTAMTATRRRQTAKVRAAELCRLLGVNPAEAELYRMADLDVPEPPDPAQPWPGARIVQVYRVGDSSQNYPHAAVRRRPRGQGYEAVAGILVVGRGRRSVPQGYRWDRLVGCYPSAAEAEAALRAEFGAKLKPCEPEV